MDFDRSIGIGGTDAQRIMQGDWRSLYLEKIGEKEPEDLSHIFRVQLGLVTEPFHLTWISERDGIKTSLLQSTNYRELEIDGDMLPMFASQDGWDHTNDRPVQLKHSNQSAVLRERAYYYAAQLTHYMIVANRQEILLSVIPGNDEPLTGPVELDDEYARELLKMEAQFWWHVTTKTPPDIVPKGDINRAQAKAKAIKVAGQRSYDFEGNNQWAMYANDFLDNQQAAATFESAKKELKELVPDDAAEVTGHGILVKRNKRGALTITAANPTQVF